MTSSRPTLTIRVSHHSIQVLCSFCIVIHVDLCCNCRQWITHSCQNHASGKIITQQAHHLESTCNWGGKLVDTCSTKNPGVFHVDLFMCVIGFIYTWIHVAFLMWIIGVQFQVYSTWIVSRWLMVYPFTWISDGYHVKNAILFCFTCFPRVFFTWIIGVPIHVYIWWISSEVWALIFFTCNLLCISHVDCWCTFSDVFHVNCFT